MTRKIEVKKMEFEKEESSGLGIFVFGNRGYATVLLEDLLVNNETVVGICCRVENKSILKKIKQLIVTGLIKTGVLRTEVFTFKNPFRKFTSPNVIACKNKIPVIDAKLLKTHQFEKKIKELRPDLILVAGFHRIIPLNIIEIPPKGIFNIHPSLLPNHRGGTPNRWVIRNGERESGITMHLLNEDIDCGDMVLQEKLAVNPDETWGQLELRMVELSRNVVKRFFEMLKSNSIQTMPQNHEEATYEPAYNGEHQRIDWHLSAHEVKRICYAIRPKSGGMTFFHKFKLCVWDIEILNSVDAGFEPGNIIEIDNSKCPIVACGKGAVRLVSFLCAGRIVPSKRMLKTIPLERGGRFV